MYCGNEPEAGVESGPPRFFTRKVFEMTKPFEQQYSGDASREFWRTVNSLPDAKQGELYSLGCALQDLEGRVITALNNAIDAKPEPEGVYVLPGDKVRAASGRWGIVAREGQCPGASPECLSVWEDYILLYSKCDGNYTYEDQIVLGYAGARR